MRLGEAAEAAGPKGTGGAAAAGAVRALHERLSSETGLDLPLRLWDSSTLGPDESSFRVVLTHPWSLRALIPPSDLAAGRAYVEGDIDIEGSVEAAISVGERLASNALTGPNLAALAPLAARLPRPPKRSASPARSRFAGRRHSRRRDRQAIEFHYDLPEEFYAAFLDENLVYSCAYFASDDEDLEPAQVRKLDLVCRKLRLRPGMHLLDIGCGWGSLLLHAAEHYGVTGVGITLSSTQFEAARRRIADAGLADRLQIRLEDYRDVEGEFDAIASVGMVEHVGPDNLPTYFNASYRLLRPGGLFCSHGIVEMAMDAHRRLGRRQRTFVSEYVFPDGELTPAWMGVRAMEQAGFELIDVEQLRPQYAQTLRHWVRRLETNHAAAVAASSERDYRIWRAYMAGSAHSFATGSLGVVQLLGCKAPGGRHHLPRGRAWMLPGLPSPVDGESPEPM
ncbi:MAG TPA: cyclopropane-fatty-acyl-phospholipid synthase family protein [Egibacteraceae bacterium]|nr:cyclopropane-fatty-acyl-phospholipid synthase family protein [Egibacteraceae bacterium]